MTLPTVAFLGLGAMGSRIASQLLAAGYSLSVWNRSAAATEPLAQKGATVAPTPREAALQADIVCCMVTDDEASRSVWLADADGAMLGLKRSAIALELSTLTPRWLATLAQTFQAKGAVLLAAPVVGSRPQAEAGRLACLLGGPTSAVSRVRPIVGCFAGAIHIFATCEQAMAFKLSVNALFAGQIVALCEQLALLRQAGLTTDESMAYFAKLPVVSMAVKGASGRIVAGNSEPLFPMELVAKDLRYAMRQASERVDLPVTATAAEVFGRAIAQGLGNANITYVNALFDKEQIDRG